MGTNTSWFTQNGVCPHRKAEAFHYINEYFDDRVIDLDYCKHPLRNMVWPPYSLVSTHFDLSLWWVRTAILRQDCQNTKIHFCSMRDHSGCNISMVFCMGFLFSDWDIVSIQLVGILKILMFRVFFGLLRNLFKHFWNVFWLSRLTFLICRQTS